MGEGGKRSQVEDGEATAWVQRGYTSARACRERGSSPRRERSSRSRGPHTAGDREQVLHTGTPSIENPRVKTVSCVATRNGPTGSQETDSGPGLCLVWRRDRSLVRTSACVRTFSGASEDLSL